MSKDKFSSLREFKPILEDVKIPVSDFTREKLSKTGKLRHSETRETRFQNFLSKSKEVHSDKYDYSKVEFVSSYQKVIIICPIHGEFKQIPKTHVKGIGCRLCGYEKQSKVKVGDRDWISDFKEVWGDKIDYSKFQYVDAKTKGTFICREHGEEYQQGIYLHLRGSTSCLECRKKERSILMTRINKSRVKKT